MNECLSRNVYFEKAKYVGPTIDILNAYQKLEVENVGWDGFGKLI